ncbi:MAG: hypothetical protein MR014_10035 [Oscillospiraceae bacterium]|nr:hypothetical protein [Oscillospiraceae bacterium]
MKHLERLLLLAAALAVGGGLGYLLLPGFDPAKMALFAAACLALGEAFYRADGWISKREK